LHKLVTINELEITITCVEVAVDLLYDSSAVDTAVLKPPLPLIHTNRIIRRNSKYQPFLQMPELPVRCCGTVGSNIGSKFFHWIEKNLR